jgi:hypothetical protein
MIKTILFCFFSILVFNLSSQIHCGTVELVPNTSVNELATFDDFSYYQSGYNINSVAKIRVRVTDQSPVDLDCSWSLVMTIENNPGAGTPGSEWEELATYGNGSSVNPTIDMLEVRVRNTCATSPNNGAFQSFTNHGDIIDIIAAMLPVTPAGSCTTNVNGSGDYLTNYSEYNFNIDIRLKPGFQLNPGIFQLNVKFTLTENP